MHAIYKQTKTYGRHIALLQYWYNQQSTGFHQTLDKSWLHVRYMFVAFDLKTTLPTFLSHACGNKKSNLLMFGPKTNQMFIPLHEDWVHHQLRHSLMMNMSVQHRVALKFSQGSQYWQIKRFHVLAIAGMHYAVYSIRSSFVRLHERMHQSASILL